MPRVRVEKDGLIYEGAYAIEGDSVRLTSVHGTATLPLKNLKASALTGALQELAQRSRDKTLD